MDNMHPVRAWLIAIRPKTLPAAVAPVILGTAVAAHLRGFALGPALAALWGALMLQTASNLANDIFDSKKGADQPDRLGPTRVVSSGIMSAREVGIGLGIVMFLALCAGSYLVGVAGPSIAVVGVLAATSAIAYTAGPFPLGYLGLGDLFVFVFFGPVAVAGTAFVQLGYLPTIAWYAGVSQGALAANILIVNNLRDIEQDNRAGKRTLAVRFGERFCLAQYATFLAVAYVMPVELWLLGGAPVAVLAPLLTLPLAYLTFVKIVRTRGPGLNALLARTAQLMLLFSVLFSLGLSVKS
jgi:1,4-dihydroxy-2-naphthoate octaprenyltransferase